MSGGRKRMQSRMRMLLLTGLAALVAGEWLFFDPVDQSRLPEGQSGAIGPGAMQPLIVAARAHDAYAAITEDDLFAPGRTPPPGAAERLATTSDSDSDGLRVIGIVTAGTERVALLERQDDSDPMRIRVGDTIGGARVSAIAPSFITLQTNGLERTLRVEHQDLSGAQGAASQPDAAAPPSAGDDSDSDDTDDAADESAAPPAPRSPHPGMSEEEYEKSVVNNFLQSREPNMSAYGPGSGPENAPNN